MANGLPQIDFGRIRQHDSSQQRAWEELAFILIPDIEALPDNSVLERRSAPDGGIEFSTDAPPTSGGGRWAWQAKFVFKLDASAFEQMSASVGAALLNALDLTRYVFVLPIDRTSIKAAKRSGAMEKWEAHVARWRVSAAEKSINVEFGFIGHSAIVQALQLQKHAGVVHYFFNEKLLTEDFFRRQVAREISNLGQRYDPKVHVDLEIAEYFEALCRSPKFVERIARAFREMTNCRFALQRLPVDDPQLASAAKALDREVARILMEFQESLRRVGSPDSAVLLDLSSGTKKCQELLLAVGTRLEDLVVAAQEEVSRETESQEVASRPRHSTRHPRFERAPSAAETRRAALYRFAHEVWRQRRAIDGVLEGFAGVDIDAARIGALLLEGPAGCGKSHLIADVAQERAEAGLPTVLILGQDLRNEPLWPQIAKILDLSITGIEFLGAMEVAARLRGGGRALIAIDALNDGGGADLWSNRLAGFLVDVAKHPWIALALTVRDSYAASVVPAHLSATVLPRATHPGLSGHEEEALTLYCNHYQLRLPDIPPLLPELSNPLFLRSLCSTVKARGLSAIPREASSVTWVFSGFVGAINDRLSSATRLDVNPALGLVEKAAAETAIAMLDEDSESLSVSRARSICDALHMAKRHSRSLFEGLVAEGLLLRERSAKQALPHGEEVEQVRFTYQRLGDHLRAEAVLARCRTNEQLSLAINSLASGDRAWSRVGLIEALVLLVPERRAIEVADLLKLWPTSNRKPRKAMVRARTRASLRRSWLRDVLGRAFFRVLAWRVPASIDTNTRRLIARYLNSAVISDSDWLSIRLSLACVPDHPLNFRGLDTALHRMSMPERDALWSDQVLSIWSDESSPIVRTIDWAWSGASDYPDAVVELAAPMLAWLMSSPNRRLRDTATKALLRLLDNRTRALADLLSAFERVDDPYIVERLLAVACGHVARHRCRDATRTVLEDISTLAERVFDRVFGCRTVPNHLLVRHYARTCVGISAEILGRHGRVLARDIETTKPPYGSSWPLKAPSLRALAREFRLESRKYLSTATLLGYDFDQYVVGRGLADRFALPNQSRQRAVREAAVRKRLASLHRSITRGAGRQAGRALLRELDQLVSADDPFDLRYGWEALCKKYPEFAAVVGRIERLVRRSRSEVDEPVRPDARLLARWISERVLRLGWTRERFGELDNALASARASRWPETERFGKKYAWIGYYELVGHLADHCTLQEGWRGGRSEAYEGPWQIAEVSDLDPTCACRGDEPPANSAAGRLRSRRINEEGKGTWWSSGFDHELRRSGSNQSWLTDVSDIPESPVLLQAMDPTGKEWLSLESHLRWRVLSGDGGTDIERRELWVRTQANLFPLDQTLHLGKWSAEQNWMGLWMPTPSEYPSGYLGCFPDLAPWAQAHAVIDGESKSEWESDTVEPGWTRVDLEGQGKSWGKPRVKTLPLALATASYHRISSRDFSAQDLPVAILPAPLLIGILGARWAGSDSGPARALGLGEFESEHSWLAGNEVVAFATAGRNFVGASALFVRAEAARRALGELGLGLWTWLLGEKIYWTQSNPSRERAEICGAVSLVPSLVQWGLTVDYRSWQSEGEQDRKRLLSERSEAIRRS